MAANDATSIFMTIGMFLILLFAISGNILTVIASCRFSTLRSKTHFLIINLAISDILISVLAAPLRIMQFYGNLWSNQVDNCRVVIVLTLFFCNASVLNLTLISIDRAVSIVSPLTYNHHFGNIRFGSGIAGSWFIAVVISVLPFLGFGWQHGTAGEKKEVDICRYLSILDEHYVLFVFGTAVFGPFLIMTICYVYIFRVAIGHVRKITAVEQSIKKSCIDRLEATTNCSAQESHKRRPTTYRSFLFMKELKAAKMIAMVIGFFVLCVVPIVIVDIVEIACGYQCTPSGVVTFAVCLSYMNPAVNILAYATVSADYRKAYKKILKSIIHCTRSTT